MQPQPAREKNDEGIAHTCQAQSHLDEPCNAPGIVHCEKCDQWLCAAHVEDHELHACVLEDGDIGGEG